MGGRRLAKFLRVESGCHVAIVVGVVTKAIWALAILSTHVVHKKYRN